MSGSVHTDASRTAMAAMFDALASLAEQLEKHDQAALDASIDLMDQNMMVSQMVMMLVLQLLPAVAMCETREADACLQVLSALMMKSRSRTYLAIAKHIIQTGSLANHSLSDVLLVAWSRHL